MMNLENEIAIVTGASRGIGAEIARKLAAHRCRVAINYNHSRGQAEALVAEIRAADGTAAAFKADVTRMEEVNEMTAAATKEFGAPTILVNNAFAPMNSKKINKTAWSEFQSCIDTGVQSAFNCCAAVTPAMMKARRGKIVNIVSQYSFGAPPTAMATYVTAKYALLGFSKCLAVELAPFGVRVNMVSPGFTETDFTAHIPDSFKQSIAGATPLKRHTQCADTANAVLYLVSDLANFITGVNLPVCGGNVM